MQTSFPDLPFRDYGEALLYRGFHSAAKATPRTYPRTDLETLIYWDTFPVEIHNAIQFATQRAHLSSVPFSLGISPIESIVTNEEELRAHAKYQMHVPVQAVSRILGLKGAFVPAGAGNVAIIGDPDFSWIMGPEQPHSKLIVEYKTWWAADLTDLLDVFERRRNDVPGRQSFDALQQTYGYMTFNHNKFGILTNWKRAVFLRRAETAGRKTFEYYLLELGGSISMLKAWVGILLLAEDNWFYASPTLDTAPPSLNSGTRPTVIWQRTKAIKKAQYYDMHLVNGEYQCLPLDFRLCFFDLSSARRGTNGCVVNGRLLQQSTRQSDLQVIYKVVDILRYHDAAAMLDGEASAYAALKNLQGLVIPKVYGFYKVWGILRLLVLQPVGDAIGEDEHIDQTLREQMKLALKNIHNAGFVHGDIARRNFCRTEEGKIFLVDLERCRCTNNLSELGDEMNEVDRL